VDELTREELADLVRAALVELGDTADRVAETIRLLGIVGEREDPCGCPLALYLARVVPELDYGDGRFVWRVGRNGVLADDDTVWMITHPLAVRSFITAFDLEENYQDLAAVRS